MGRKLARQGKFQGQGETESGCGNQCLAKGFKLESRIHKKCRAEDEELPTKIIYMRKMEEVRQASGQEFRTGTSVVA